MKTLVLKHQGHEAHVPYELPDSLRFDCFVPSYGILDVTIDPRAEDISVTCVETKRGECMCATLGAHDAAIEQAGDVCAVFELAFNLLERERAGWSLSANDRNDLKVLSTIAEMALLESDLHTADLRLSALIRESTSAPPDPRDPNKSYAHHRLQRFIVNVLVPRAQDLATAAAKRREAQWIESLSEYEKESAYARGLDMEIKAAKEGV